MRRLAWFAPLPPSTSGIAFYNAQLLPHLAATHHIDVFVDAPAWSRERLAGIAIRDAHDFVWKRQRDPYDLVVYQLGNAECHEYMWPYLVRYPGLTVLHDGQVHHSRAKALLREKRFADYREEFWYDHPDVHPDLAELGADGLLGSLTYFYPMVRVVLESSRLTLVHNDWLAGDISERYPNANVRAIDMGVPKTEVLASARREVTEHHRIPDDRVLFMAFGKVTPEKRIAEILEAFAHVRETVPGVHLLLAGEAVDYYDVRLAAAKRGVLDAVTIAGYLPDADVDRYLSAADVCLCLRWPSSRETSASWLRCIAAGKPTITTDLVHTAHLPALDPRNWVLHDETAGPVTVSTDILDEVHSLTLAMRRLAEDASLRRMLGRNARTLWAERFQMDVMVAAYLEAIDAAIDSPYVRPQALPAHLTADGTEYAARLVREAGLDNL